MFTDGITCSFSARQRRIQVPFFWGGGTKCIPVIGDSMILFCHTKDYFYLLGSVVWIKDDIKIFSSMMGGDILVELI